MESMKEGKSNSEWISEKKKCLLQRRVVLEENSQLESDLRTECHKKRETLQLDKSNDDKVPLPSMYIALPTKSPPSKKPTGANNAFIKEKIYTYSSDDHFRTKLINDILKKMEYSPRKGEGMESLGLEPEKLKVNQDVSDKTPKESKSRTFVRNTESRSKSKHEDNLNPKTKAYTAEPMVDSTIPKKTSTISILPEYSLKEKERARDSLKWDGIERTVVRSETKGKSHEYSKMMSSPVKIDLAGISRCAQTSRIYDSTYHSETPVKMERSLEKSITDGRSEERLLKRLDRGGRSEERSLTISLGGERSDKSPIRTSLISDFQNSTTNSQKQQARQLDRNYNDSQQSPRYNHHVTFYRRQDPNSLLNIGKMKPRDSKFDVETASVVSSLYDRFSRSLANGFQSLHTEETKDVLPEKEAGCKDTTINSPIHRPFQSNRDFETGFIDPKADWSGSFSNDSLAIINKDAKKKVLKSQYFQNIKRPIPLPLQRNLSIGLYSIQVADIQNSDEDSKEYTQLIIKARAYRKWCIMFRMHRILQDEERRDMDRAYEHWKCKHLKKCFTAMRGIVEKKMGQAIEWHKMQTLEKVFKALVAALIARKKILIEHLAKRRSKVLALAWVKWSTAVSNNKKGKMRIIFTKWKERQLEVKRELLLHRHTERQVTSNVYYKWKMTYTLEQQGSISNLHFKIVLLSKCWQFWRVYTAERRVKNRMTNVARIHFEQHSLYKMFNHWKEAMQKSSKVSRQIDIRLTARVFYSWKNWAAYSKVLGQRQMSACKEYHNRSLLRSSMDAWRIELKAKLLVKTSNEKQLRRAFQLWCLRLKRKVLHRKLCRAQGRKARQSRCFMAWLKYTKEARQRRDEFVKIVTNVVLKSHFKTWREYTSKSNDLGESSSALMELRSRKSVEAAFERWKHSLKILYFTKRVVDARTERIARFAAKYWRNKVKKKKLQERLISGCPVFEFLRLKGALKQWIHEKRQAEKGRQRALVVASILKGGCLSRAFSAWRIVTQEDRIIHHTVERRHRRNIARVFDAWRLVVTRKKVSIQYRHVQEIEKLQHLFFKWKLLFEKIVDEKRRKESIENETLFGCIAIWKDHVTDLKRRKLALAENCFCQWRRRVAEVVETRDEQRGTKARDHLILKMKFRIWMEQTSNLREKRCAIEKRAEKFHLNRLKIKVIKNWRRQFQVHCFLCDFIEERRLECLENAFETWKDFVREQLRDAMERFTDRLEQESSPRSILRQHTLSESYGSGNFPPLRSSSGYFGSLPNISRAISPLPISPLANPRSLDHRRGSPASLSPEHALLVNSHYASDYATPSPTDDQKRLIFNRQRSFTDRPKSPISIRSAGTSSSKDRIPVTVPPLFTDISQLQDEDFTELVRPNSLSVVKSDISPRKNKFLSKDKSLDEDMPAFPFSHNSDEDAMSYYSFQSESVGMNREIFMSGTIRHWRRLPLSITFKAWLKFTQQQRIRRELLQHFISYKSVFTVKRDFYLWHRKLYCRLASERFMRTKLLGKYFRAMSSHRELQKSKKDKNLVAKFHLKNTRIETKFKMWRRRFLARRRLQTLVGRWQEAIHISGTQRSACERFLKKREIGRLKNAFQIWKDCVHKNNVALEFSEGLVLKRALLQWQKTASKFGSLHKIANVVVLNRTTKVFVEWQRCLKNKKIAEAHWKDLQQDRGRKIFIVWRAMSKKKKMLSENAMKFQRKLNFKMIVQAFFIWSEEATRFKMADDHHRESLMIRAVESWHALSERKNDLRTRLFDFQRYATKVKLRDIFDWWKRSAICSKVFKERKKIQEEELLKEVFLKWSGEIRQKKWENHLRITIERKAFVFWFRRTVYIKRRRNLAKIAAKKWIFYTQDCVQLQITGDNWLQRKQTSLLRKKFSQWREAANGEKLARFHYEYHLVVTTIRKWSTVSNNMKNLRKIQCSVEELVEYNNVSTAFGIWSALFKRYRRNSMVLENYLELRKQEHLKICLQSFKSNALKGRSERYGVFRLQRMVFQQWKNVTKTRKSLAIVKERLIRMTVLKMASHWREKTKDQIVREKLAESVARKKDMKQMKKTFLMWLLKTRGRMLAKMCFESHLVKRTFQHWQKSTRIKVTQRNVLKDFKKYKEKEKLGDRFRHWKKLTNESKKTKKLDEIHSQIAAAHYREKLLEKYFYNWRSENIIEKSRRQRSTRTLQQFFTTWKQLTLEPNKAEQMYEQTLIEKTWRQWRMLKIKRRVMKAMQEHEAKKQLSEVFSSWYNYTYIRRQAIREFQFKQKEKIFRKWMQEYNKA